MKAAMNTTNIMKEWFFCDHKNRYICKDLSESKALEIDIDGTIYFHISLAYSSVHYRMIRKYCDTAYDTAYDTDNENKSNDNKYYENCYKGPVECVARDLEKNEILINLVCTNNELFEAFLRWEASLVDVISFLEKYATK